MMCSKTSIGNTGPGALFKDCVIIKAEMVSRWGMISRKPGDVGGDKFNVNDYGLDDGTTMGEMSKSVASRQRRNMELLR